MRDLVELESICGFILIALLRTAVVEKRFGEMKCDAVPENSGRAREARSGFRCGICFLAAQEE